MNVSILNAGLVALFFVGFPSLSTVSTVLMVSSGFIPMSRVKSFILALRFSVGVSSGRPTILMFFILFCFSKFSTLSSSLDCLSMDSKELINFEDINKRGINICHINVRSIKGKLDDIKWILSVSNIKILCITETWLTDKTMDSELQISHFNLERNVSVTFGYQVFRHRDELSRVVRSVVKAFVDTSLFNLTTPFEIQLLL